MSRALALILMKSWCSFVNIMTNAADKTAINLLQLIHSTVTLHCWGGKPSASATGPTRSPPPMLLNSSSSCLRSGSFSHGSSPSAIIWNSAEPGSGVKTSSTPITPSSVIIAPPSSPWRRAAPACSRSLRTRAATAAVTARPALPGTTPTSPASPVRNLAGSPMAEVVVRSAAASSANSMPARKMPVRAESGLTRSATEASAMAHASRRSARSATLYSAPPMRLAPSVDSLVRATVRRASAAAGGQYPGDGASHHGGSSASSAAAAAFTSLPSSFLRSFAAFSEYAEAPPRESDRALPRAPRAL
mmetsp:Transcript_34936/g.85603  ORF Transcript_34936/g.85603 Transcript_34936/m.85603 type:complete len:304 (+) Transcript_34936:411-1322(+)